jgi:hypothetical protein
LARDGHIAEDVVAQLGQLPLDATHLVVSAGGNDALGESILLQEPVCTVGEGLGLLGDVRDRFRNSYRGMLQALSAARKALAVCTIYEAIPGFGSPERTALATFNEIILHEAFCARIPVIDLRLVCDRPADYSHVSSIEPSVVGGGKIVRVIAEVVTTHDFASQRSIVYT